MRMLGPFSIMTLVIAVLIVVPTAVAMFFLRGFLGFGFVFPLWILVIILMIIVAIMFVLISTITGYLRYGREGFIFSEARKRGIPVYIDAELGSEVIDFVLGEKSSPKDIVFKDKESGVKVDPSMLDAYARPMRAPGGLDLYLCSYYNFMAQSLRNTAAFAEVNEYFNTKCQELNFLTIKEFVELLKDPEHYLERNASNKLNKYFKVMEKRDAQGNVMYATNTDGIVQTDAKGQPLPLYTYVRRFERKNELGQMELVDQDMELTTLVDLLTKARADVMMLPLMPRYLAGNEAFKYNSVSYSSQHLAHVLMLYQQKMMDDMKKMLDWLTVGICALMILVGGGVAVYIASMAFKGGG